MATRSPTWASWSICSSWPSSSATATYAAPICALLAEQGGRRLSRGALFTSLDRLEVKGLVRSRMGDPLSVRGGRARRYFEVTPAGFKALRSARATLATLSEGLDTVLESKT